MKLSALSRILPSRKGIMGINKRNLEYIYTHNKRTFFPNVDDKLRCKQILQDADIPIPKTLYVVESPKSLRGWEQYLIDESEFVIKPNRGYGGNGIKLITKSEEGYLSSDENLTKEDIEFHLLQICNGAFSLDNTSDIAYFETMVINHPALERFLSQDKKGITDIRIIFQDHTPIMAMLRAPTEESDGKANLHQGGIGVGIDLNTTLTTHGCHKNNIITNHPDYGYPLEGFPIPYFDEMKTYGSKISKLVNLGYIGVDFVCDANNGPMVLEVNARPGLNIQIANQIGLEKMIR